MWLPLSPLPSPRYGTSPSLAQPDLTCRTVGSCEEARGIKWGHSTSSSTATKWKSKKKSNSAAAAKEPKPYCSFWPLSPFSVPFPVLSTGRHAVCLPDHPEQLEVGWSLGDDSLPGPDWFSADGPWLLWPARVFPFFEPFHSAPLLPEGTAMESLRRILHSTSLLLHVHRPCLTTSLAYRFFL